MSRRARIRAIKGFSRVLEETRDRTTSVHTVNGPVVPMLVSVPSASLPTPVISPVEKELSDVKTKLEALATQVAALAKPKTVLKTVYRDATGLITHVVDREVTEEELEAAESGAMNG